MQKKEPLVISTTSWIGYTPLLYAKESGWLEGKNIKLLHVTSLSENLSLFKAGNAEAFSATQYEYNRAKLKEPSLVAITLFDRSNGGDLIMSNDSLEEITQNDRDIDVYLEMDSVNGLSTQNHTKNTPI